MESDALRLVRNSYFVGLYEAAMKDAKDLFSSIEVQQATPQVAAFAEIWYYRALAHINPALVIKAIPNNASTGLQVIKQYAQYRLSNGDERELILETLSEWQSNELTGRDITLTVILAHLFFSARKYKQALQLVLHDAEHLEKLCLTVMVYLAIDRFDLAAKTAKVMADLDDDDVLTQLVSAWVLLSSNSTNTQEATTNSRISEAESIFQGLNETFPLSPSLLTSLAVCEMNKNNHTDAFRLLKQAREAAITSSNPNATGSGVDGSGRVSLLSSDILLNSIVCLQQIKSIGGEETIAKVKAELKGTGEGADSWMAAQTHREEQFDRLAANYTWTQ